MEMADLSEYLKASKDALDILKGVIGLLPKGTDAGAAQKQLEQADQALKASEAQLAKALGYPLCKCTFPPQIMLLKTEAQVMQCPRCGNEHDPHRRVVTQNPEDGGWAGARRRR